MALPAAVLTKEGDGRRARVARNWMAAEGIKCDRNCSHITAPVTSILRWAIVQQLDHIGVVPEHPVHLVF